MHGALVQHVGTVDYILILFAEHLRHGAAHGGRAHRGFLEIGLVLLAVELAYQVKAALGEGLLRPYTLTETEEHLIDEDMIHLVELLFAFLADPDPFCLVLLIGFCKVVFPVLLVFLPVHIGEGGEVPAAVAVDVALGDTVSAVEGLYQRRCVFSGRVDCRKVNLAKCFDIARVALACGLSVEYVELYAFDVFHIAKKRASAMLRGRDSLRQGGCACISLPSMPALGHGRPASGVYVIVSIQ